MNNAKKINEIIIRQVREADLEAVVAVEATCFPSAEAASKRAIATRIEAFKTHFFVATYKDEVIGFINGAVINEERIYDELFEEARLHNPLGHYQAIYSLAVHPAYGHCGIGSLLMQQMITKGKDDQRKGVILTCKETLLPFYERFGYKNLGVSASVHGGAVWYDMLLTI
nr:GNAT family N-acetyltransferase [uncultured Cellulosilyticum sp.]